MATKYTKWPQNIPNGLYNYQHLPLQNPPKFTQIGIIGLKICHLATLAVTAETLNAAPNLFFDNASLEFNKGSEPGLPDGLFSNQKSQFG
jgi:hypothetical protein